MRYNYSDYGRFLSNVRRYRATQGARQNARLYRLANRERYQVHDHNKRQQRRSRKRGHVSLAEWRQIKARHGHRCAYCGRAVKLEMDHRVPLSRGGLHVAANIAPACRSCNATKYTMTDKEFRRFLRVAA